VKEESRKERGEEVGNGEADRVGRVRKGDKAQRNSEACRGSESLTWWIFGNGP
jgi:hypothetical protein